MILKEDFQKSLKDNYSGATVWVKGKLKMKEGKVLDEEWWKRKIAKACNLKMSRLNRHLREKLGATEKEILAEESYVLSGWNSRDKEETEIVAEEEV